MYDLKNKVVLITGASSGIGAAMAMEALRLGAKVGVCARSIGKLKQQFDAYDPGQVLCVAADVSKEEDCKNFIEACAGHFSTIDVLINNAGISMRALFEYLDLSVLKELMDINFWGMVYCSKYALPYIKKEKGVILGVSSIAGFRGLPARTGYSSSKFAMQGFLEALRTELLHTGTHVMWVSPGFTSSNIRNVARNASGNAQAETPLEESKLMSSEECAQIIFKAIERRKRTVVMTGQGKITVWLNKLWPALADKLVFKHFLKEPDSPLINYK